MCGKNQKNFVEMQNSIFIILQQSATVESVLHFWKVANLVVTTLEFQKVQHARNSSCWCKSLKWWHRGLEMEISQQNIRGQSLVYWKTVNQWKPIIVISPELFWFFYTTPLTEGLCASSIRAQCQLWNF